MCSLLKYFFRASSIPLFTFDSHAAFLANCTGEDASTRITKYIELIKG